MMTVDDLVSRFRPNLVVSGNGMAPYAEDEWSDVIIGGHKFKVRTASLNTHMHENDDERHFP